MSPSATADSLGTANGHLLDSDAFQFIIASRIHQKTRRHESVPEADDKVTVQLGVSYCTAGEPCT
jgi:hypothetical protein